MDTRPSISVIIPYYNVPEELFSKCIDSVLAQTFKDFEVLLVNDGSTEQYRGILENAEKRDPRIKLINKLNGGVSSARNIGVQQTTGSYITFVDSDDAIARDFLEHAYSIVQKENSDMVIGATKQVGMLSEVEDVVIDVQYTRYDKGQFNHIIPHMLASNRVISYENGGYMNRGPVARLVKAEIAKTTVFPEEVAIGEDIIWNQRILKNCSKITITNEIWYYYVQNNMSASFRYREDAIDSIRKTGIATYNEIDLYNDQIYRAFCHLLLMQTRNTVCQACLTNRKNEEGFFVKWGRFNKLKRQEPWSLISKRLLRIGSRDEKFYYLLFKTNLYFPLAYLKDRLSQ